MIGSSQLPFITKVRFALVCVLSMIVLLYIGKSILIPVAYATIIAILLNPFVEWLTRHKFKRTVAILVAVFLTLIVAAFITYLVSSQLLTFIDTFPKFRDKLTIRGLVLISWISDTFNISTDKINDWIKEKEIGMADNLGGSIETILGTISTIGVLMILMPVYISMILFYKPLITEFIRKQFSSDHLIKVLDIITKSKKIIQTYLIGLIFEMLIIATLNSLALILLGIDYAIILGIIGALINIIPVFGGVVAIIPPMMIAFITKDSASYSILVVLVFIVNQIIDKYYIIPLIVASKVKINALVCIIVVFIGGALWGIPGMFLSIPVTAIIKVISDNIDSLKPFGFLLGNVVTLTPKRLFFIPRRKINKVIEP